MTDTADTITITVTLPLEVAREAKERLGLTAAEYREMAEQSHQDGRVFAFDCYAHAALVETDLPEPVRPIQVGDEVEATWGARATVLAIDGDVAWVRFVNGGHPTWRLADLRHAPVEAEG